MNIDIEISPPLAALENMQKDEALFFEQEKAVVPQTHLRFYSWQKPAVTFGYAQKPEKLLDLTQTKRLGIETAQRITGGGMVFHQPNELTYSLIAPLSALPDGIIPSCNAISEILIKALRKIGISAELATRAGFIEDYDRDICFVRPTKYEVVVQGKKLIGSAQKRGRQVLLQHGSLALEPILPVFAEITDIEKLKKSSTNVQDCLANTDNYTYKSMAEILAAEFKISACL